MEQVPWRVDICTASVEKQQFHNNHFASQKLKTKIHEKYQYKKKIQYGMDMIR